MHELLAPLLYVLQVDLESLSEVRKLYEDLFTDRFDELLCEENDLCYNFEFQKSHDSLDDETDSHGKAMNCLDELDPEIQTFVLLSDAYGAEGELGIVLSEKFMEHDAFCMFDALMTHGSVATANFFSSSPVADSLSGLSPVIEASTALYHLLSLYFSLRWLRVLFGREFSLDNLLIIWDEIFASDNNSKVEKSADDDIEWRFRILHSPRGAFISAIAVAMLLHLRSSLLATENPTTCLQRLLNFPEGINLEKLLEKAKSLQALALSVDISSSSPLFLGFHHRSKSMFSSSVTLLSESASPKTPMNLLPDSYWEDKWRVAQNTEEKKVKIGLRRTESDPPPSRIQSAKRLPKASVRRSLLEDLHKTLGLEEDAEQTNCHEILCQQDNLSVVVEEERQDGDRKDDSNYSSDDRCPSGSTGSEDNFSVFSECNETSQTSLNDPPVPTSVPPENIPETSGSNDNDEGNSASDPKERKQNKLQWVLKFGRKLLTISSIK
ncbi:putative Rab-GTPase-TBC domain-containing protein [Lupinus albus]|uniref:Putative Rab-GTPase-TBC domain-containing protein n=1 Tax=Lupinus albus TaxID=3870 RepID=A0A6A4Q2B8_LUPAL|nr:putative Rab-GTPase-TBC domain-containing protein [Lupinus albus]